ncbi:RNA-guided pseudouridylation complex pseudouridine synthase subunit Cbf5 [Methanococcoides sp. NM1]|uniref:RNA-guided pseudouridylation complex pseudouridine synthase subunit Cbf5 n=1 Tax=Methanococcoides sp. NM1 TaxID=1201013 RepID=UPI0010847CCC|nr:RNA-guided pseudouridylation complex pseudouridine synthase subunit Cbf5 [Methanococcoides sp. NM1]
MVSSRISKDVDMMVVKAHATTNAAYGCKPEDRPILDYINLGVVNIDKPVGPTSHEVTAWIRDMLGVSKAGHSGSLDPGVTGVLPVMLGKATKAVSALRLSGKEYICLMHLHNDIPEIKIRRVCKDFNGPIYQTPPIISAVKRQLRIRNIYYLDVLEIDGREVLMRVGCEAGTYLRKLCHDIGLILGCGANMKQLRRTGTGPFREDSLVTLYDLKDACVFWQEDNDETELRKLILPMEEGLSHLPRIIIRDTAVDAICRGAYLAVSGIVSFSKSIKKDDKVALFTLKGEAVALCKASMDSDELLNNDHGISCITERVIMDAAIYPRCWKAK